MMSRSMTIIEVNENHKHEDGTRHHPQATADHYDQQLAPRSNSLPNNATYMNTRSASIPISQDSRGRTTSETQLTEDMAQADYKDFLFYSRVVHGISRNQRHLKDGYLKYENQMCLNNIVSTRHTDHYHKTMNPDDWSDQQLNMMDHMYYQDPESSEDAGIFELDL
jgi:hypothetical protein